ncbi:MAG: hypothetical protein WC614_00305 [bacterium]
MNINIENYENNGLKEQGTGEHDKSEDYKIVFYPFDKYQIGVKLTLTNEFIEITEVKINKSFLSYEQKTATKGYHDVDKFYSEE